MQKIYFSTQVSVSHIFQYKISFLLLFYNCLKIIESFLSNDSTFIRAMHSARKICSVPPFFLFIPFRLSCLFILLCSYLSPIFEILCRAHISVLLPRHSFPSLPKQPKQPSPTNKIRVVNSTRRKLTHLSLSTTCLPWKLMDLLEIFTVITLVSSQCSAMLYFRLKSLSKCKNLRIILRL